MSKSIQFDLSVAAREVGSTTNITYGTKSEAITGNDTPGLQTFTLGAGASLTSIKPANMAADMEFVLIPTYSTNANATKKFSVKVTHASGDSTFQARTGAMFSVLGTDTAVEVANPDVNNAMELKVVVYTRS